MRGGPLVEFVTLANDFSLLANEFVSLAFEFVTLAQNFVRHLLEFKTMKKKLTDRTWNYLKTMLWKV